MDLHGQVTFLFPACRFKNCSCVSFFFAGGNFLFDRMAIEEVLAGKKKGQMSHTHTLMITDIFIILDKYPLAVHPFYTMPDPNEHVSSLTVCTHNLYTHTHVHTTVYMCVYLCFFFQDSLTHFDTLMLACTHDYCIQKERLSFTHLNVHVTYVHVCAVDTFQ